MKIELCRPADVQGWCKPKAVVKITYYSTVYGFDRCLFLESASPDTKKEADEINNVMNEIVNKLQ